MGFLNELFNKLMRRSRPDPSEEQGHRKPVYLSADLCENISRIKDTLGNSPDLVVRQWRCSDQNMGEAAVIYVSGLTDAGLVNQFILQPLLSHMNDEPSAAVSMQSDDLLEPVKKRLLPAAGIQETDDLEILLNGILSGNAVLLYHGSSRCLLVDSKGWEERGVEEPTTETAIRGPKDGFTENMTTNIALVRRKIKDPDLRLEYFNVGKITRTNVSIIYIKGIAMEHVVAEVRERIGRIRIDGILESGYIEELIQDKTFTLFPTIYNSERPDVIAAGLLEGRVAILVDGTPFVLLVPAIFPQFFQSAEDYYQRSDISTLLRLLRYLALAIALLGPSLYIAITTYHHDMLPPELLISLSAQREGIPFPAFIEALMMEVTFELLREAGIRLPRAVGQAISIVGALVIGQAAVEAGIVSAAMVIVVSITAIASFVIPSYNMSIPIRILRFGMMGLAASFGLFGILAGLIGIVQHLCHLRSFGIPYMSPFGPSVTDDKTDTALRVPWWGTNARSRTISRQNRENNPPSPKIERDEN
jgi:spore germination protein KA